MYDNNNYNNFNGTSGGEPPVKFSKKECLSLYDSLSPYGSLP